MSPWLLQIVRGKYLKSSWRPQLSAINYIIIMTSRHLRLLFDHYQVNVLFEITWNII